MLVAARLARAPLAILALAALSGAPAITPAAVQLAALPDLSTARFGHTTTLLQDGRILVVGGLTGAGAGTPLVSAALFDPSTGGWTATASLPAPRSSHTATLVPGGKVLVAGGQTTGGAVLGSALLYDPAAGTWSAAGTAMTHPRSRHAASRLPDGRVLLVGGFDGATQTGTAERYDPVAGTFTATGSLGQAREGLDAVALQDGRVLVTGGLAPGTAYPTACERFDPATGTWSPAGDMILGRVDHTSTILPGGAVVVIGGRQVIGAGFTVAVNGAERYDPAGTTGTWAPAAGAMAADRWLHVAALLPDGQVLVAGGSTNATVERFDPAAGTFQVVAALGAARGALTGTLLPSGKLLLLGGSDGTAASGAVGLVSSATPAATAATALDTPRDAHTATLLLDGTVLVVGGQRDGVPLAEVRRYHPSTGTWTAAAPLLQARWRHSATLLPSGEVLVAGGWDGAAVLSSTARYDPGKDAWTTGGPLTTARAAHTASFLHDGRVLVTGGAIGAAGVTAAQPATAAAELFDPRTGAWSTTGSLVVGRQEHAAATLPDGRVLVAGGLTPSAADCTSEGKAAPCALVGSELFDPATGSFARTADMTTPRSRFTLLSMPGGFAMAAGGFDGSGAVAGTERFDPATGTWTYLGAMNRPRHGHALVLLPSGEPVVMGGRDGVGLLGSALSPGTSVELYDPASRAWTDTAGAGLALGTPRSDHTATLLPDGRVLVVGGDTGPTDTTGDTSTSSPHQSTAAVERFDAGHGAQAAWTPTLGAITVVTPGGPVPLTGTLFTGVGEASSGGTASSNANAPLVQFLSAHDGTISWVTPASFTASSATAAEPGGVVGAYWLRVFSNGVPSTLGAMPVSTPLVVTPGSGAVAPGGVIDFGVSGGTGYGYQYAMDSSGSGGTIDPATGHYQAGAGGGTTDVVRVTDPLGQTATVVIAVLPAVTTTTLLPASRTAVVGEQVTLTATVTTPLGPATGSVTFGEGATTLATVPLDAAGQAALRLGSSAPGARSITAAYPASAAFQASSGGPAVVTVGQAATTTLLLATPGQVPAGAPVTLTATLLVTAPGAGTPSGSVTFLDGGVAIGTGLVDPGTLQAVLTTSALAVASHALTARYEGDGSFLASTSAPVAVIVTVGCDTTGDCAARHACLAGRCVPEAALVGMSGSCGGCGAGVGGELLPWLGFLAAWWPRRRRRPGP